MSSGYIRSDELGGPVAEPTSPAQAMAEQNAEPTSWTIPVYADDGVTQVDTFTIEGDVGGVTAVTQDSGSQ